MRVLALYLPQYHAIPENDLWWGRGYTEWSAVKAAKPLFFRHNQPRIPLDDNYYDLSDESATTWEWQAELARKYDIYGFCIYHYWFGNGKQLLQKPMEILLKHKEIDIRYCICWANESWTRTWYGLDEEILAHQIYGNQVEWEKHFEYLIPFFQDERYIKIDNKPLINIYHSSEIVNLKEMKDYWEKLAINIGFSGVYIVSGNTGGKLDDRCDIIDAYYNMEPGYTLKHNLSILDRFEYSCRTFFATAINQFTKKKKLERKIDMRKIYKSSFHGNNGNNKVFLGSVPMWDNTPRRGYKGLVYEHCSPELFRKHLEMMNKMLDIDDFVYINAWNEWGEGAYLEPDVTTKYAYLEAVKESQVGGF